MSDTSDVELSKEQQLEAARKKFAELKKKKAKKEKKGKKEVKDDEAKESEEAKEDEDIEDSITPEVTKSVDVSTEEVKTGVTKDATVPAEVSEVEAPSDVKSVEVPSEVKAVDVAKSEEDKSVNKVDAKDIKEEVVIKDGEPKLSKQHSHDKYTPSNESIERQLAVLEETVEQQKSTISRLRDENTDLKLSKMDLDDTVHELRSQLALLKETGAVPPIKSLQPAKAIITTNEFASESKQKLNLEGTSDFRESLLLWKGWQVDMTVWNVGGAQMVSF